MPLIRVTGVVDDAKSLAQTGTIQPVYAGRQASTDSDKMSKAEWAQKDAKIGYRGILQACVSSPTAAQYCTGNSKEEFAAHMLALADMLNKGCLERGF